MATDIAEEKETDVPVPEEVTPPEPLPQTGFRLSSKKLKLILLLLLVMGVQVAVGYMLLPEPAVSKSSEPETVDELDPGINTVEVPLGQYNSTNSQAALGSVIHVSFKLTAIVAPENARAVKDAFSDTHESRIRAAVVRVVRSSSLEDLDDPELNVMKRKIRAEIDKVLPNSFIIEVIIGDVRLIPQ
jgi:flagellar basal body-associated protein FliL